jgi:hypothetical protein
MGRCVIDDTHGTHKYNIRPFEQALRIHKLFIRIKSGRPFLNIHISYAAKRVGSILLL